TASPVMSGATSAQFAGSLISSSTRDTIFGFAASATSMIRAMGNGGKPLAHAAANCAEVESPPDPASSTEITYGFLLIVTLIVCCAVEPSRHNTLPSSVTCGFATRDWT